MKKVFVSFCMAGALFGLASCGSTKSALTLSAIGGEWNIIEINGSAVVPVPGQEFPYIGFDTENGRVYGCSGCNRLMGSFDVQGKPGRIDLGNVATTRMLCADMTLEQNVLSALGQVKRYVRIGEENVALCGSSNRPLLVLQKKAPAATVADLAGRWRIRQALSLQIPAEGESKPFLNFDVNRKQLSGLAGCNRINGGFQTENDRLTFSQMACTMMACPDMTVEQHVLQALEAARRFEKRSDGSMAFYDEQNAVVMVLEK